jgi:hypothetical protein
LSFASPPYAAVIEWDPTARVDVLYVATPPPSVPVPSVVLPSLNVTVPVAAGGVTVAVKVTDAPKPEGFAEDATVVVVLALLTGWVSVAEVLVLSLASPP